MELQPRANKTALITGAAKRVGAAIAVALHQQGYDLLIHYHHSKQEALELQQQLNQNRSGSAFLYQANLVDMDAVENLANTILTNHHRIDLLINNASAFFPTPLENSTQEQWDTLINTNLRAPYFLSSALRTPLAQAEGCIINMIDIHAQRGLPDHPIYSIAKAGLEMMTKSLAKELAPLIRVNGIAPGVILWPENEMSEEQKQKILDKTLLQRPGECGDLADAAVYLAGARYVTGHILTVDGGKSLFSH